MLTTAAAAARERAKGSQDTDLKAHINTLYDELLTLKELVIRLTDENNDHKRMIAQLERSAEKLKPELWPGSSSAIDARTQKAGPVV